MFTLCLLNVDIEKNAYIIIKLRFRNYFVLM
jgi:hypothetical protein